MTRLDILAQATRKRGNGLSTGSLQRGLREGALLLLGAIALYLLVSLATYRTSDPSWSHRSTAEVVENSGGVAGAWFADIFLYLFGFLAYLIPVVVGYLGWLIYRRPLTSTNTSPNSGPQRQHAWVRGTGALFILIAGCGLATLKFGDHTLVPVNGGGVLGDLVSRLFLSSFNAIGTTLLLLALLLTGVTWLTGLSWLQVLDSTGQYVLQSFTRARVGWRRALDYWRGRKAQLQRSETRVSEQKKMEQRAPVHIAPATHKLIEVSERVEKERQVPLFAPNANTDLPPLALLDAPEARQNNVSAQALEALSRQLELKLRDFGIEVRVVEVHPGPVITRFEIEPAPGVKVSQISNLSKDLARSLSVVSVRVVEIIPGKSYIGIEIPNERRELVRLSEILCSKEYDEAGAMLPLALGKNIGGAPVVVDLARMPHLLVAGTTGAGKSVAVNAMILSLLYSATPNKVRLIMVDPKMLELSVYAGIPHLLAPVVTDMKEAANALRWCVAEMERRYRLMSALGVRNIAGYNRKVQEARAAGEPLLDPLYKPQVTSEGPAELNELPLLVVIIDELADMMMVVGKKVEELIARLAQKARASGIHLILATQRPSVDVITGLIKANIPTRIAFQVSSRIDSRTILDQMGAEQLLGHGDMLYLMPGSGIPMRVHGAFVADHEVHKVVAHLQRAGAPQYLDEILTGGEDNSGETAAGGEYSEGGGEADALYDQALRIVTESRRATISSVQRRLKIGYNRAARIIEDMERAGVVGPLQSNGMREILAPPPPSRDD